jgi:hypothetical protein
MHCEGKERVAERGGGLVLAVVENQVERQAATLPFFIYSSTQ